MRVSFLFCTQPAICRFATMLQFFLFLSTTTTVSIMMSVHCVPVPTTMARNNGNGNSTSALKLAALTLIGLPPVFVQPRGFYSNANTSEPIQLALNRRFLNGARDGIVDGVDQTNALTAVWQRLAVRPYQILIRNVKHCFFVCINNCGYIYSARTPTANCLWTETLTENNYSTYYRVENNTNLYLALNNKGRTRRTVLVAGEPIGKSSKYAAGVVMRWFRPEPVNNCIGINKLKHKLNSKPKNDNCAINDRRLAISTSTESLYSTFSSSSSSSAGFRGNDGAAAAAANNRNVDGNNVNTQPFNNDDDDLDNENDDDEDEDDVVNRDDNNNLDNTIVSTVNNNADLPKVPKARFDFKNENAYNLDNEPDVKFVLLPKNHGNDAIKTTLKPNYSKSEEPISVDIDYVINNLLQKRHLVNDNYTVAINDFVDNSKVPVTNIVFQTCKFVKV
nr:FGF [Calliteara abietis nucleopolyhedrovirus]